MKLISKYAYWFAQFIGWSLLGFITLYSYYSQNKFTLPVEVVKTVLFTLVAAFIVTHLFKLFFTQKDVSGKRVIRIWPIIVAVSVVMAFVVTFAQAWFATLFIPGADVIISDEFFFSWLNWEIILGIWIVIYMFYRIVAYSRREELNNLRMLALSHEIELNNLRSQLNPHFMFNSMNSIRALVDENPGMAKEAITKLSNILRSSLQFSRKNYITLGEEISLVKDYLALEKIRFEERLSVETNVPLHLLSMPFPPLMIQTLAENAVKHGISKLTGGGLIKINITDQGQNIEIEISNTGNIQSASSSGTGVGVENTRKRLILLYGEKSSFHLEQRENLVVCKIVIPINIEQPLIKNEL